MKNSNQDRTLQIITHAVGIISYIFGALLIYILSKDKNVKKHATLALNWQISLGIYYVGILTLSSIANIFANFNIPIYSLFSYSLVLSVLSILNVVFCIIASIKASEGKLWVYPLSINFLGMIDEKKLNKNLDKGKEDLKEAFDDIAEDIQKVSKKSKKKSSVKKTSSVKKSSAKKSSAKKSPVKKTTKKTSAKSGVAKKSASSKSSKK